MKKATQMRIDGSEGRSIRFSLYLIAWLTDFSAFLLIFVVSRGLAEQGAGLLKMGTVGGGLALVNAFSSAVFGHLSDHLGRRRLIFAGLLLLLVSASGCYVLSPGTRAYFGFYWGCGIALGLIYPSLIAWLSQERGANKDARGVSRPLIRFCLAWNVGLICGQLCGGWLFALDRHWPIALSMVLTVGNLLLVLMSGPGPQAPVAVAAEPSSEQGRKRARSAAFARLSWVSNLGHAFAVAMILHVFPKLAVSLGVPAERHGAMVALMRVTVIAAYLCMHHSQFWHYRFSTALAVQAAGLGGLVIISFTHSETGLLLGLVGLGLLAGYNYFASLYYSTTGMSDDRKGFASGLHEGTLGLGLAAGSFVGGMVGDLVGPRAPYLLAACVILAMAAAQIGIYARSARTLAGRMPELPVEAP